MKRVDFALVLLAQLVVVTSAAAFVSFNETAFLHPDFDTDGRDDYAPDFEGDGAGNWVAATTGPYVSRSADNGLTWTTPMLVLPGNGGPGIWAYEPHVVTDGAGTWLMAWAEDPDGSFVGVDAEVLISRSIDNGATWSAGVAFASNAGTDAEYDNRPRLATDGAGKWMAVWHTSDPINGDDDLMFTTSVDNGVNWSPVDWIDPLATFDSQDDNWPNVATDGAGNWVVVYNNFPGTTGRERIFRSNDFGANWSGPTQIATTLGLAVADISSGGAGVFVTAHCNLNAIASRTTDGGVTWTSAPVNGPLSGAQHRATLATDGVGGWVLAWGTHSDPLGTTGSDNDIAFVRSSDNGAKWTSPSYLNLDASTDGQLNNDDWPTVAADGNGTWFVAWQRESTSAETDQDIMIARSEPLCPLARRNDCIPTTQVGKSSITMVNPYEDEKDKLTLKLSSLGDTDKTDFGNPLVGGDFALCQWDASGDADRLISQVQLHSGGTCDAKNCWTDTTPGYKYKDSKNENGAMTKGQFKSGLGGKAKIKVQFTGLRIGMPVTPLVVDTTTAVQLISLETDVCWSATFATPTKNDVNGFKAKSN